MDSKDDIEFQVLEFLRTDCFMADDELKIPKPLFSTGRLSSIDFIDLIAFLDERFGLRVENQDANFDNLDTVQAITTYVAARRQLT